MYVVLFLLERDVDDQVEQRIEEPQHEMSKLRNFIYVL